ncbi:signal peptidase I [uncultured Eubacterium sp.]|uniref:signal peptidase I n=1 Tax=uncultured Eubacterium sp. TaxID=165185 RepID=UPI0025DE39A8|nr:signal peptidase I [uncultured Eubacterium sp.]MCI6536407.1 signal peptidase I [Lachnospiraceae bacterium]
MMRLFRSSGLNFRRKRRKMKLSTAKSVAAWVVEIIIVLLVAFVLVYCAGMRVTVVGNSMESTISDGSQILVNRFVYNIKSPKSGDVIVFLPNGNEKSHYYVKRVIGVPGDKVQIKNGLLYVNGELYDMEDTDTIKNAGVAEEEITVGEDEYFVLGDNRNSSEDSRYANIGNIKKEYIKGKAWFVVRPFKEMGRIK